MRLAQYLKVKKLSRVEFAAMIGVTSEAVRLYMHGRRIPRREQMMAIHQATQGRVTAADFYAPPLSHAGTKPKGQAA